MKTIAISEQPGGTLLWVHVSATNHESSISTSDPQDSSAQCWRLVHPQAPPASNSFPITVIALIRKELLAGVVSGALNCQHCVQLEKQARDRMRQCDWTGGLDASCKSATKACWRFEGSA